MDLAVDWSSPVSVMKAVVESAPLIAAAGVLITGFVALFKYLGERESENQWRRTQLVADFAKEFERDLNCKAAMQLIVRYRHGAKPRPELDRILKPDADDLSDEEVDIRLTFDRYLDFLDRLCAFVVGTETMTEQELLPFSYYMDEVREVPPLKTYAENCGFASVVLMSYRFGKVREEAGLPEGALQAKTPAPS